MNMDFQMRTRLEEADFDVDGTLERFLGKEELYFKFLKKFKDDKNIQELLDNLHDEDVETAFRSAHTLKGVTANLGINLVLKKVVPIVEILRSKTMDGVEELLPELKEAYDKAIEVIDCLD